MQILSTDLSCNPNFLIFPLFLRPTLLFVILTFCLPCLPCLVLPALQSASDRWSYGKFIVCVSVLVFGCALPSPSSFFCIPFALIALEKLVFPALFHMDSVHFFSSKTCLRYLTPNTYFTFIFIFLLFLFPRVTSLAIAASSWPVWLGSVSGPLSMAFHVPLSCCVFRVHSRAWVLPVRREFSVPQCIMKPG